MGSNPLHSSGAIDGGSMGPCDACNEVIHRPVQGCVTCKKLKNYGEVDVAQGY